LKIEIEFQNIRKELVDGRVLEAHIVPHKLLFTSQAPTLEYPTVAWLPEGIQVKTKIEDETCIAHMPQL
jgi:hypothetical protein